jgi:hypothetical protein
MSLEKIRNVEWVVHHASITFTSLLTNSAFGKKYIQPPQEEPNMKKIASLTVALGLMASIAATASAAEVTGTTTAPATVTGSTYSNSFETIITPADMSPATPQIVLTEKTPFYFSVGGIIPAGWLGVQTLDTTGEVISDTWGNEWREIYTWLGKAWVKVPVSANVILP